MKINTVGVSDGQIDRRTFGRNHAVSISVEYSDEERLMAIELLKDLYEEILSELKSPEKGV